jgi:ClpP class serine protease
MWLLEPIVAEKINKAIKDNFEPSAAQEAEFKAIGFDSSDSSVPRIMTVAGETAEIAIQGILTPSPDIMAMIFGGGNTTYPEIISAIASAEQNDDIKNIVLAVDSPGGFMNGLFSALNSIALAKKPVKAVVSNLAASAAYAIVSQADEIIATNELSTFGSIGVMADFRVDEKVVTLTSTKAPKKAPDVTTEAGKEVVVDRLDALHEEFVAIIARGREVTPDTVNKDFGEGGVLLAKEAKDKGMIDGISNPVNSTGTGPVITDNFKNSNKGFNNTEIQGKENKIQTIVNQEEQKMNLEELKATHPSTYTQVLEVGKEQGKEEERIRAAAHLTMGDAFGAMDIAIKAITDGSDMNPLLQAQYQSASKNKESVEAALADSSGAIETPASEVIAKGSEIADKVESLMGINKSGGAS